MKQAWTLATLLSLGVACGDKDGEAADTGTDPSGSSDPVADSSGSPTQSSGAADSSSGGGADSSSGVDPGCAASEDALADCADESLYLADLEFVAQTRAPDEPHWQVVQDMLATRLGELGYEVELDIYETGTNVIGRLPGTLGTSDVIVSAHYDSVPVCEGADDNASGVAGALEAARVLALGEYENDLVIAFWDEEELGLIGATSYVARAVDRNDSILANYNLEMIGYTDDTPGAQTIPAGFDAVFPVGYAEVEDNEFRGNFITIVADDLIVDGADALEAQADRLGLPAVRLELGPDLKNNDLLRDLRRSDHAPFWEVDLPAMMITDTSEFRFPNYHCDPAPDVVADLDHAFTRKVIAATVGATASSLVLVGPRSDG